MATPVQSHSDLAGRLDFETLISDLSARLVTAPDDAFGTVIEEALGRVSRFFGADRGGILAVSQDQRSLHLIHAWYAETLTERVPGDINLAEHFPYGRRLVVDQRQPFIVHSYDDVPEDAVVDRASHAAMGVRSTLNIPIAVGADLRYVMNIDALGQEIRWPPSYVPRLQLLGEIFANAVERRQAQQAGAQASPSGWSGQTASQVQRDASARTTGTERTQAYSGVKSGSAKASSYRPSGSGTRSSGGARRR